MIHVYDQNHHIDEVTFNAAYMTHTSTSPNYQILASLDIGRRQAELRATSCPTAGYLAQWSPRRWPATRCSRSTSAC